MSKSKTLKPAPAVVTYPAAASVERTQQEPGAQHPRAGSKQAIVVGLLSRSQGASLADLIDATGWLPHTARAALTGLRKRGFPIERLSIEEGRSVYRILVPEAKRQPGPKRRRGRQHSATQQAA